MDSQHGRQSSGNLMNHASLSTFLADFIFVLLVLVRLVLQFGLRLLMPR